MPPRWRNQRDPTGPDTPTATAASSLLSPSAILAQNARSTSGRRGGRPGDRIGARPVCVDIHAAVRPIVTPLLIGVLRRPLESALTFTDEEFRASIEREVGTRPHWSSEAFPDLEEDVRAQRQRILDSPFIPVKDSVRGF